MHSERMFGYVSPRRFAALLVTLLACTLLAPLQAQTAIRGQVSNDATRENLEGVRIQVSGQAREYTTGRDGSYDISDLPPGTYTLTFNYPGLDSKTATVVVENNAIARQDVGLTSGIYVLPEFAVAGDREGNAAAIVQQRRAVNVQNVVTSDAFGNMAKGNVGNFLKRIPGIAGTTDEVDTENILVRGIAANFTSLDIDGTRTANGSPDGRNQSAAGIPADMIEKAEVIKATTPDVDADSLGGRVNLVTKSAFDRKGRNISLRAAASYSMTYGNDVGRRDDDPFAPSVSATYSDVFSVFGRENNLGIIAQANYERILDVRGTTAWNWGRGSDNSGTLNVPPAGYAYPVNPTTGREQDYPQFNNVSVALHEIVRGSGSVRADYKFSDRLTVGGTIGWSTHENNMWRSRNQLASGVVNPTYSGDLNFTVIDGARYRAIRETRDQKTDKTTARFNAKWRGAGDLKVDFDASFEKADREEYRESINPTSALRINYVLDRRQGQADARWPAIRVIRAPYAGNTVTTTSAPTSFLDVNAFADNFSNTNDAPVFFRNHNTENEIFGSRLDVTKRFSGNVPIELKSGLRYRSDITKANRDELNGAMNLTTSTFGRNLSGFLDDDWNLGGAIGRYPVGFVPDEKKLSQIGAKFVGGEDPLTAWNYNPAIFTINNGNTRGNSLLNDRKIWEDVSAGYVQGKAEVGKLEVLAGVRLEHTEIERSIPKRNRRPGISGTLAEYTGRERNSSSYDNWFPSVHLRYEFGKNLVAHAAYSTTIGRQNYGDLLSAADADPNASAGPTITIPNLDLNPQESTNYDVSLEYYFEPIGVISIGAFRKDIKNYAVTVRQAIDADLAAEFGIPTSDIALWQSSTKMNGGEAKVEGIELNYSQSLSFLPGAFKGLGVFANYTKLRTEGTYTRGNAGAVSTDLENFIPQTANAGINYAYGRYDVRFQWNYTDAFPEDVDLNNPLQRNKWRGERWQFDFSGRYKLTRKITIFADLVNLSTNHGKKYRGTLDEFRREETNANGFVMTAGILANF